MMPTLCTICVTCQVTFCRHNRVAIEIGQRGPNGRWARTNRTSPEKSRLDGRRAVHLRSRPRQTSTRPLPRGSAAQRHGRLVHKPPTQNLTRRMPEGGSPRTDVGYSMQRHQQASSDRRPACAAPDEQVAGTTDRWQHWPGFAQQEALRPDGGVSLDPKVKKKILRVKLPSDAESCLVIAFVGLTRESVVRTLLLRRFPI